MCAIIIPIVVKMVCLSILVPIIPISLYIPACLLHVQAADVGVGVLGKEGRQAASAADFAVPQFRFLVRLLLVHGHLSEYRLAKLIKYGYYKNIAFGAVRENSSP